MPVNYLHHKKMKRKKNIKKSPNSFLLSHSARFGRPGRSVGNESPSAPVIAMALVFPREFSAAITGKGLPRAVYQAVIAGLSLWRV